LKRTRLLFQAALVAAAAGAGLAYGQGWLRGSVEKYCPFGGLETAYAFVTNQRFTCAAGELNLALFLALLGLTLVARKAFCAWVCPVGAVSEWLGLLGTKLLGKSRTEASGAPLRALEPPRRADRLLRWIRVPVLGLVLYFTYKTGELVFRGYDPYYVLFSFHGHDVRWWSYLLLAVLLAAAVAVPMAWCRYLCPLGLALWPFASAGRLRLARDAGTCTSCRACDRACPHAIVVSSEGEVRSGECTLCLACADACPAPETLTLRLKGLRP
jgi:polyferredoxin